MNFCVAILILKMEEKKQHFWHIMLYYFKKSKNATEMHKKICAVYGEGAVTDRMCQKWFVTGRPWFHGRVDQLKLIVIKSKQ